MAQILDRVLSVSKLNQMIKGALEKNLFVVEGEVTGFTLSKGKFVFLDLKDDGARVGCFMMAFKMGIALEDGMKMRAVVKPSLHVASGRFSLTIESYEVLGEGDLKKAYELTKKKLTEEGLFAEMHKQELPRIPSRIAIVTSEEAAAYTDALRVMENRWGGVEIFLAPVSVQGPRACEEICAALRWLNENMELDVILLTRGGGSLEELQAFNNEQVCRAIFASKIPVVSAVGHERDVVLADFVADVRASTPSNAAERIVPDRNDVMGEISYAADRIESWIGNQILFMMREISYLVDRLGGVVDLKLRRIDEMARLLQAFDPRGVLKRGYSIVSTKGSGKKKGHVVRDASAVKKGDELEVIVEKGKLDVVVSK